MLLIHSTIDTINMSNTTHSINSLKIINLILASVILFTFFIVNNVTHYNITTLMTIFKLLNFADIVNDYS